jgi:CTP:molybdopterin cytidylyltransferase MocA
MIGGRAMVEYVLAALRAAPRLDRIALVGPHPLPPPVAAHVDVAVQDRGDILDNLSAGLAALAGRAPALVAAADIPLLTARAIDAFLDAALGLECDIAYGIVPRDDMMREFPAARKTFVRVREGIFTGGSLVLVRPPALSKARDAIAGAVGARKSPLALARLLGPGAVLGLLTGTLGIADLEKRIADVSGVRARAVICRHPEIGVDVDRPEALAMIRERLSAADGPPANGRVKEFQGR